jgi:hypothetical protein
MGWRLGLLAGVEAGGDGGEEVLVGMGACEEESHAPAVAHDHRAYLEEFESDGSALGTGEFGALESEATNGFYKV